MRDVRVQVLLKAEEYMDLSYMADEDGDSHSGFLRRLLLNEKRRRAVLRVADLADCESVEGVHGVHTGSALNCDSR